MSSQLSTTNDEAEILQNFIELYSVPNVKYAQPCLVRQASSFSVWLGWRRARQIVTNHMDSDDYQHELYTSTRPQQTSLFRWKTSDLKLDPGDRLVGRGRHRARIYDFFVLFITKDGELLGKCRICEIGKPPVAYSCRTYSNLESHLFRKKGEKLHAMGLEMHIADKKDRKRKKFPESGSLNSVCPPRNTMENLMDGELGQRAFEYGLTLLLATLNLPLNISREKAFRLFLKFCGCSYTIPNHYTIRHRLSEMAVTIREKLSTQMRMAKLSSGGMPYLHLTSDAWTAKYTMQNFATVTAHYVTGDFKIESRVVAARPSRGRKTQTQIALWLSAALRKECEIDMGDIATITTDGAADFRAAVKNQTGKEGIHCCAHRLDLALSFGMCCGDKRSKYPTEIRSIYESARAQAVVFTTSSAKAKELLDHCSNGSELKMFTDINVRWCSSFNMYVRILRLKEALDRYYQEKRTDRPFEHFETLAQIIGVVRPFSEVLKRIQSPTVSIGHAYYLILDAFTMMDTLDIPTTEDPGKYKQMQSEELNKTARMVWERIRQQIQSRFFSDKHVLQKHFLMSYYLDVVFRFSLRVLQECRFRSQLSNEGEELLLKKAREYVKGRWMAQK